MTRPLVGLAAGLVLLVGATTPGAASAADGGGDDGGGSRQVFSLTDPRIDESSGLVDRGATMVTTDDSGSDPVLYLLDAAGRTTGVTTYAARTLDVEALAPGRGDRVWVGDIGDNRRVRETITVHDVEVLPGERTVAAPAYDLAYPDGPHDAESLLVGPDGRLLVVTKALFGGTAYAAPRRLDPDRTNRLEPVGRVAELATDAALTRDGRHALVRGPGEAGVYALPSWERLATLPLPAQPQGEGISVGPGGRVRVSSEGAGTPVWQVALPDEVRAVLRGGTSSGPSDEPAQDPVEPGSGRPTAPTVGSWAREHRAALAGGGIAVLALAGAGLALGRRRR
ncbi:hypothetical protein SAMN04488570_1906 [Nocardioides scoriae]|uniref:WD40 repeat domain-containing protein n=1 Tax=Nocardioides scoriae TaxID=642780 RepID=A0A1H1SAJ5_9ACTN|nr:hypothetical protein [Nocardioides scoriae]SDS45005.1 hypothetical protein SAMN04488570_1906 [Nocardioides scoriae]